jgi:HlyD family secretion protein
VKSLKQMRWSKWLGWLLLLGGVAAGGYWAYNQFTTANRNQAQQRMLTATVERVSLPITISANGIVQPERAINLSPKTSGIVKELLVKEGDRVQQGQTLARMDDSNLQGQYTQALGAVESAKANLQRAIAGNRSQEIAQAQAQVINAEAGIPKAQAQLAQAQANLQKAQLDLERSRQLFSQGAINQRDLDAAQQTYDVANAQIRADQEGIRQAQSLLAQAKQALSLQQAGTRPEEVAAARAEVTRAQGQLQTVQAQLNDTVIRAPFSGIVTRKYADPGAFVAPTTSASSANSATSSSILALASRNQVTAKVAETNIPQIKLGQTVAIEVDAYPGKSFAGRVTQIAAQSTVEQNVTNFEVKMSVQDPQAQLKAGMNGNVEFQVGNLENALVIPTVAIVRQEEGTGVLMAETGKPVKPEQDKADATNSESKSPRPNREAAGQGQQRQGDRPKRRASGRFRPIQTGLTVGDKTVVLSGLKAGDNVLISFPEGERPPSRTPSLMPGMERRGR